MNQHTKRYYGADKPRSTGPHPDPMTEEKHTSRPIAAIENLRNHQIQCDMDGVMIQVSRQALDEVLDYLAAIDSVLASG